MRRYVEYGAYRALAFLVPLLPRRPMVWLGRRLGALFFLLSPRVRRVGLENLRRALPECDAPRRVLRESLRLQAVALLDALWSARLTPDRAAALVAYDPAQGARFEEIVARGRGAVVATAHFGSWEMFNLAGGALGLPRATFIARPVRNELVDRHLKRSRERTGNLLAYRRQGLRACMSALRRGEIACSVMDTAVLPSEGGVFVDLLSIPASTSAALPALAVRHRAPLLFATCQPVAGGLRYRLEAEEIAVRADDDPEREVRRLTAAMSRALEERIRAMPEAWIWSYKRWKWRPSELPGPYPDYSLWIHPFW